MAVIYRTTGPWGAGKGAVLTKEELDGNFHDLAQQIAALVVADPVEISNVTVVDNQMTIHMEDGSTFGPFTLPVANLNFRGPWADATNYLAGDLFTQNNTLYFVNTPHLSASPFNASAGNIQGPFATAIMPFPSDFSAGFFFPGLVGNGISDPGIMFAYQHDRDVWYPANLTGSVGALQSAATGGLSFPVYRNGDLLGTADIAAGAAVVTFAFTNPQQFVADDVLIIMRHSGALDATAKNLTLTIKGVLGQMGS